MNVKIVLHEVIIKNVYLQNVALTIDIYSWFLKQNIIIINVIKEIKNKLQYIFDYIINVL